MLFQKTLSRPAFSLGAGLLLGIGGFMGFSDLEAVEGIEAKAQRAAIEGKLPAEIQQRRAAVDTFRQKLNAATTPEAKKEIIREFQAETKAYRSKAAPASESKSTEQRMAELKEQAKDRPEMLARLSQVEARMKGVEAMKAKLAEAQAASGEQKLQLMEEFRREQKKLMEQRQAEIRADQSRVENKQAQEGRDLPPQMAAMKAKSEKRKQEIEQFKEALNAATPEERKKLMSDWRAKRQAEILQRANNAETVR